MYSIKGHEKKRKEIELGFFSFHMCFEFVLANMYSMLNAGHRLYYVTAKAQEVVLQNVASHLKGHESPQGISNNKKG